MRKTLGSIWQMNGDTVIGLRTRPQISVAQRCHSVNQATVKSFQNISVDDGISSISLGGIILKCLYALVWHNISRRPRIRISLLEQSQWKKFVWKLSVEWIMDPFKQIGQVSLVHAVYSSASTASTLHIEKGCCNVYRLLNF